MEKTVTHDEFFEFVVEVLKTTERMNSLYERQKNQSIDNWYSDEGIYEVIGITPEQVKCYREAGIIGYSLIDKIYFYPETAIDIIMDVPLEEAIKANNERIAVENGKQAVIYLPSVIQELHNAFDRLCKLIIFVEPKAGRFLTEEELASALNVIPGIISSLRISEHFSCFEQGNDSRFSPNDILQILCKEYVPPRLRINCP